MGGVRHKGTGRWEAGAWETRRAGRKAPLGPRHAITLTVTSALLPTHVAKQAGNKDYARERAAQELRKKRAEGVAPWGFDDVKPARQWYEQGERAGQGQGPRDPSAPDEGGKQGEGGRDEKAERRRRRSERDRLSADPVSAFLKTPGSARAQPSPGGRPSRFSPSYQSLRMAVTAGKQEGRGAKPDVDKVSFPSASLSSSSLSSGDERKASGRGEAGGREKRQVRGKKESAAKDRKSKKAWKEKKREKKKKEKRSSKEEKRQPENCGVKEKKDSRLARSRGDDGPQVSGQASSTPSSSSELHLLRQRRLEREREEHCKAVQLLAARQRAGLSYPTAASPWLDQPDVEMDDRKREYNSRFHLR